jgi:hypothetical protein
MKSLLIETNETFKAEAVREKVIARLKIEASLKIKLINLGLISTDHESPNCEHNYRFKETLKTKKGDEAHVYMHLPTKNEIIFII